MFRNPYGQTKTEVKSEQPRRMDEDTRTWPYAHSRGGLSNRGTAVANKLTSDPALFRKVNGNGGNCSLLTSLVEKLSHRFRVLIKPNPPLWCLLLIKFSPRLWFFVHETNCVSLFCQSHKNSVIASNNVHLISLCIYCAIKPLIRNSFSTEQPDGTYIEKVSISRGLFLFYLFSTLLSVFHHMPFNIARWVVAKKNM